MLYQQALRPRFIQTAPPPRPRVGPTTRQPHKPGHTTRVFPFSRFCFRSVLPLRFNRQRTPGGLRPAKWCVPKITDSFERTRRSSGWRVLRCYFMLTLGGRLERRTCDCPDTKDIFSMEKPQLEQVAVTRWIWTSCGKAMNRYGSPRPLVEFCTSEVRKPNSKDRSVSYFAILLAYTACYDTKIW